MRTSRIGTVTSSIYRNAKRFVDTDTAFTLMSEHGSLQQFNHERHQQNKKKRKPINQAKVQSNKQHVLIKGILFNPDNVMRIRNELIHTSLQVHFMSNRTTLHRTYRNSI